MAHNLAATMDCGNINVASDMPSTVSPHSLLIPPSSSTSTYMSSNSAPIPPPPHIPSTTFSTLSPAAVISRPPHKRYVRPRATTEAEKEHSLKEENTDLRTRIATREQRMQALESQPRQTPAKHEEGETSVPTHQSARPM